MKTLLRFLAAALLCCGLCLGGHSTLFSPSAAQAAGVVVTPTPQLPQAIVRENFIQQATKCIQEARAEAGDTRRCTIEAINVPAGLRLPWGKITYSSYLPNGVRKSLATAVEVQVLLDGRPYARMTCVMRVRTYEKVLVSARRIQREVPLKAEDMQLAEVEDKGQAYERYTDVQELVGKVVSSNMPAGRVLHSGMVREPILIRAYSKVNICSNVNGVVVKLLGTALETGRRGAYIMVQNDSSNRKIKAQVVDENNVQVVQ
ncbi:MAG: flagellar basal body P-ring formation chaperone FlgA [Anaerovibrio sp.]|nr:flagellar basal body P-ring formation chaperone FlgA [Anaerovibrio sp.]